jgi:hypothetical protein
VRTRQGLYHKLPRKNPRKSTFSSLAKYFIVIRPPNQGGRITGEETACPRLASNVISATQARQTVYARMSVLGS